MARYCRAPMRLQKWVISPKEVSAPFVDEETAIGFLTLREEVNIIAFFASQSYAKWKSGLSRILSLLLLLLQTIGAPSSPAPMDTAGSNKRKIGNPITNKKDKQEVTSYHKHALEVKTSPPKHNNKYVVCNLHSCSTFCAQVLFFHFSILHKDGIKLNSIETQASVHTHEQFSHVKYLVTPHKPGREAQNILMAKMLMLGIKAENFIVLTCGEKKSMMFSLYFGACVRSVILLSPAAILVIVRSLDSRALTSSSFTKPSLESNERGLAIGKSEPYLEGMTKDILHFSSNEILNEIPNGRMLVLKFLGARNFSSFFSNNIPNLFLLDICYDD
uniref:Uncharacterized protein n=1 Tax=Solanum lycopersicum TaxID=4081 RepID=A0A3Q7EXA9_SOLLC